MSVFFAFGATMSGVTVYLLLFPGSPLDRLWEFNPRAHEGFARVGAWATLLMAIICAACITAAAGLWHCKRWGLWAAIAILAINLLGDTLNVLLLHDWRTLIGLPIGGMMIWYLLAERREFSA